MPYNKFNPHQIPPKIDVPDGVSVFKHAILYVLFTQFCNVPTLDDNMICWPGSNIVSEPTALPPKARLVKISAFLPAPKCTKPSCTCPNASSADIPEIKSSIKFCMLLIFALPWTELDESTEITISISPPKVWVVLLNAAV